jgi:hypothetical protein
MVGLLVPLLVPLLALASRHPEVPRHKKVPVPRELLNREEKRL